MATGVVESGGGATAGGGMGVVVMVRVVAVAWVTVNTVLPAWNRHDLDSGQPKREALRDAHV